MINIQLLAKTKLHCNRNIRNNSNIMSTNRDYNNIDNNKALETNAVRIGYERFVIILRKK